MMTHANTLGHSLSQGDVPRLVGGSLCLDFANTIGGRGGHEPDEYLFDFRDLVAWGRYAGHLSEEQAMVLLDVEKRDPDAAKLEFDRAVELREHIYRVFSARARNDAPPQQDLDGIRQTYVSGLEHATLQERGQAFNWSWDGAERSPALLRWLVSESAVALMTSEASSRVKECPGGGPDPCGWLFLDTTKNGTRRWCSMAECGSRAKARRLTDRRRARRTHE